jgi:hypothetical protein
MNSIMLATSLRPEATLRELFHTQGRWHDVTTYVALVPRWRLTATDAEIAILDSHTASLVPAQHAVDLDMPNGTPHSADRRGRR